MKIIFIIGGLIIFIVIGVVIYKKVTGKDNKQNSTNPDKNPGKDPLGKDLNNKKI